MAVKYNCNIAWGVSPEWDPCNKYIADLLQIQAFPFCCHKSQSWEELTWKAAPPPRYSVSNGVEWTPEQLKTLRGILKTGSSLQRTVYSGEAFSLFGIRCQVRRYNILSRILRRRGREWKPSSALEIKVCSSNDTVSACRCIQIDPMLNGVPLCFTVRGLQLVYQWLNLDRPAGEKNLVNQ